MTSYYHSPTNTARNPGRLETHLTTGYHVGPGNGDTWTDELAAACGFAPVVETLAPTPGATQVPVSTVELVNGTPTRTWTLRDKTAAELAAETQATNTGTLEGKARQALTVNANFLALAAPTQAQTLAQVRALTRETTALIKLLLRGELLDNTDGT